jgi:glyoxylase-like metal-dependent hydrolase (beta-lactamase superfamily II)
LISEENTSNRPKIKRLDKFVYRLGPLGLPKVLSSYLIVDNKIAIVDCGPSSVIPELTSLISECGVIANDVEYLLLTHIHLDHAGGAASFLKNFPNAKVLIPERGYKHMLDPSVLNASSLPVLGEEIFQRWGACEPVPTDLALSVSPHAKINLGNTEIEYLPAPGHAPHHTILKMSPASIIFTADSMGILDEETNCIIPTSPPPSFDFPQAIRDITAVEVFSPNLACPAHFQELKPVQRIYQQIMDTYKRWADRASELIAERALKSYDLNDCRQLFSNLTVDFSKYSSLSADLKEQAIRIDCAGMLNYHLRTSIPTRQQR